VSSTLVNEELIEEAKILQQKGVDETVYGLKVTIDEYTTISLQNNTAPPL
jgi:hypothetical protein